MEALPKIPEDSLIPQDSMPPHHASFTWWRPFAILVAVLAVVALTVSYLIFGNAFGFVYMVQNFGKPKSFDYEIPPNTVVLNPVSQTPMPLATVSTQNNRATFDGGDFTISYPEDGFFRGEPWALGETTLPKDAKRTLLTYKDFTITVLRYFTDYKNIEETQVDAQVGWPRENIGAKPYTAVVYPTDVGYGYPATYELVQNGKLWDLRIDSLYDSDNQSLSEDDWYGKMQPELTAALATFRIK